MIEHTQTAETEKEKSKRRSGRTDTILHHNKQYRKFIRRCRLLVSLFSRNNIIIKRPLQSTKEKMHVDDLPALEMHAMDYDDVDDDDDHDEDETEKSMIERHRVCTRTAYNSFLTSSLL